MAAQGLPAGTAALCTAGSCAPASISSAVTKEIWRVDKQMRSAAGVLLMYAVIVLATIAIVAFLVSQMIGMWRQWRLMAAAADPLLPSVTSDTFVASGDDEVYKRDVQSTGDGTNVRDRINAGMAALEQTYAEYNKQVQKHAKDVLKQPDLDDRIDRRVMDRAHDDL